MEMITFSINILNNMNFRSAYIALMASQMNEHLRQAVILYQMIQQANDEQPEVSLSVNKTVMNPDLDFPNIDLSFLD